MSNAILDAIRTSTPEQKREALAVLQREMNDVDEKKKVPLPLSLSVGEDEEVALDEHGFPVLSPELDAELARRAGTRPNDQHGNVYPPVEGGVTKTKVTVIVWRVHGRQKSRIRRTTSLEIKYSQANRS